jgi:hypothetical protein
MVQAFSHLGPEAGGIDMTRQILGWRLAGAWLVVAGVMAAPAAGFGPVSFVPPGDPFLTRTQPGQAIAAAVNDSGDAVVVVVTAQGARQRVDVRARHGRGGAWTAGRSLASLGGRSVTATAAVNANGSGVVVVDDGRTVIAYRRADRSGPWRRAGRVAATAGAYRASKVVLTDAGRAVVVNATAPQASCAEKLCSWTVRVIESDDRGAPWRVTAAFTTPKILTLANPRLASGISDSMAVNRRGDVLVAYGAAEGSVSTVYAALKLADATSFTVPVAVSGPGSVRPSAAIAADGGAAVSWMVPDPGVGGVVTGRIQGAVLPAQSPAWSAAEDIAPVATDPATTRPVIDADGAATHVAVSSGGGVLVAWTTTRLGVTEAASNEDALRAAVRSPGATVWDVSPVLADNQFGRFLSVRGAYLNEGRAVIAIANASDTLAPTFHRAVRRDLSTATWRAPRRLDIASDGIVSAPGGSLLGLDSDLRVADEPAVAGAPRPPRVRNIRLKAVGPRVVMRFRLNRPATVWISTPWARCGTAPSRCIRRVLATGPHRIDLGEYRQPFLVVRVAACSPVAGCRFATGRALSIRSLGG